MKNKSIQHFWLKYFRHIKLFQYSTYLISILFLILSITCSQIECSVRLKISHQNLFQYLFSNLRDDALIHNGVELFILLQTFFLIISFLISVFIGLKTLPIPLSEKEKTEIINSPYKAFSNIFFSKILYGNIKSITHTLNMQNEKLNIVADLYLLHFRICAKETMLILIFLVLFIAPIFTPLINRETYLQLPINFIKMHMFLFLFLELIMFGYSKLLAKEIKNVD